MAKKLKAEQIEILTDFIQESREMIENLEPSIIELEQKKDDQEVINSIFRLFHSMKGGAGFLKLNNIMDTAHVAENLLDLIRSNEIELNSTHINLLCQSCDFFKEALDYVENNLKDDGMAAKAAEMAAKLDQAIRESSKPSGEEEIKEEPHPDQSVEFENIESPPEQEFPQNFELKITPDMIQRFIQEQVEILQDMEQGLLKWNNEKQGMENVQAIFRCIHSFKGNCGFYSYPDMEGLSHHMESVLEAVRSGIALKKEKPEEILLKLLDILRETIINISQGGDGLIKGLHIYVEMLKEFLPADWLLQERNEGREKLGEILVKKGDISNSDLNSALEIQNKPLGRILVENGAINQKKIEKALEIQKKSRSKIELKSIPDKQTKSSIKLQNIRVDLQKLDTLSNLIGEMVIAENMLIHNQDLENLELESFNKAAQHMNKIVRELQEMAVNIRMIPISGLFRRMIRLVHDLALKSGKKVDLKLKGEETEVDKTVIETITDPLVHLIRNSLDHGLETPEERLKAGKPEIGTVKLGAKHQEGEVWISIEDDGQGLDREKLISKAISKGMIEGDGSNMNDKEVFNLIFSPGFSTADKVTDVSGRGVGMDVVKRNLEKIKGRIVVHSEQGTGTCINLRIPLTLAIIDGMMLKVGESKYILPIMAIKESFRPAPQSITVTPDGQEFVRVREELVPVVRLHELHKKKPEHLELHEGILIVMEVQNMNTCLFVDEIIEQQQTVIKGLSDYIGNVRGISGCTILGNGEICLILDAENLVEIADKTNSDSYKH